MIGVEKFGYDCGGSLRVVYGDRCEDWMFTPFRVDDLKKFHVLGNSRVLAVGAKSIALFDATERICVGRKILSERFVGLFKAVANAAGSHIIVVMDLGQESGALRVYDGEDLSELYSIEDRRFSRSSPVFERHDGAVIVGSLGQGGTFKPHILRFGAAGIEIEVVEGRSPPFGHRARYWADPTGHKVAALGSGVVPMENTGGTVAYGVSFDIWDLDSLAVERTVVADHLPLHLHAKYCGQDLRPKGDAAHLGWLNYVQQLDPAEWDGSLNYPDTTGMDAAEARKQRETVLARHEFLTASVVDVAWEPDGQSFWVLFNAGILRQVPIDGAVSPRYAIERFATPPALGIRPQETFSPSYMQLPKDIACLADGRVRVYGKCPENISLRGHVYFDPSDFSPDAKAGNILRAFFRKKSGGAVGAVVVPVHRDEYVADSRGEVNQEDKELAGRKAEFLQRDVEAPVPLADMSTASCIAAIESLTDAIDRDPFQLVRGYWFCPTFVLAEGTPEERRMGEDEFFAYVAANAPEAAPAIKRLLHIWLERVPLNAEHRNFYMNEQTVAQSHALEALIALDPACYGTIRHYVAETDFEHDVIIQNEVLPYFGQVNGWRDMDAVRLGLFCMFLQGRQGSPRGWIDPTMRAKVEQTMSGKQFANFLIGEAERNFAPSDVNLTVRTCDWYNYRKPKAFDAEAKSVIETYLSRGQ